MHLLYSVQKLKAYHKLHTNDSVVIQMMLPAVLCFVIKLIILHYTKISNHNVTEIHTSHFFCFILWSWKIISNEYNRANTQRLHGNLWSRYGTCLSICFRCGYNDSIFSSVYFDSIDLCGQTISQVRLLYSILMYPCKLFDDLLHAFGAL